jgi:hypothetical protein
MALRKKIQSNLIDNCQQIIRLCEHTCLPLAENTESKVFIYKMIADYHRYAAESFHKREESFYLNQVSASLQFYKDGMAMCTQDLDPCNPIRLGLILNFAIYLKEMTA